MKNRNIHLLSLTFLIHFLCMTGIKVFAYDIALANEDGKTIYYNLDFDNKIATVTYKENVVCVGCNYTYYFGDITIPDKIVYYGDEYSVTSLGEYSFNGCSSMTTITIPNSVTRIGRNAFYGCVGLNSITIPNGITTLEPFTFSNCSSLTAIVIPQSVTKIGWAAFSGCSSLTSITIPNSVTSIGESAFSGCSSLTSLTIPVSVGSIGPVAFYGCNGITSIKIPDGVNIIENETFSECTGLTSVSIPNSITSIGNYAFYNCSELDSIGIPGLVTSIGQKAFASCSKLNDMYCYAKNVPTTSGNAFDDSNISFATLHVPVESLSKYKSKAPWNRFGTFETFEGNGPVTPKCATPTISFVNGELKFGCETEGVDYISEVTVSDAKKNYSSKVSLTGIYKVSVYATKAGYENSDVATLEFTLGAGGKVCDVNKDGNVDVADIATIIDEMASQTRRQEVTEE